jgi:hypothetical protein
MTWHQSVMTFITGRIGSAFGHRPGPVPGTASRLTGKEVLSQADSKIQVDYYI